MGTTQTRKIKRKVKDKRDIDNYKDIIEFYEATGKYHLIENIKVLRARKLFYDTNMSKIEIASKLNVPFFILERWSALFGWEQERERRLFVKFKTINGLDEYRQEKSDSYQQMLLDSIENIVSERLELHKSGDPKYELTVKDLRDMTAIIKESKTVKSNIVGPKSVLGSIPSITPKNLSGLINALTLPKEEIKTISSTVTESVSLANTDTPTKTNARTDEEFPV